MRLFLAVELDDAARQQCEAVLDRLRHSLGDAASAVKWTPPDNIHITLHFLGDVDAARGSRLKEELRAALLQPAFRAETTHLGAFPHGGPPKVVWLGLGPGANELKAVHRALATHVVNAGLPTEDREFSPHLTLGRVRDRDRQLTRGLRASLGSMTVEPIEWTVDHVTLIESDLSGPSPRYVTIATVKL